MKRPGHKFQRLAEAAGLTLIFSVPFLLLGATLIFRKNRRPVLEVLRRYAGYSFYGLSRFRTAYRDQCVLGRYRLQWRYVLLIEAFEWAGLFRSGATPGAGRILLVNYGHIGDLVHLRVVLKALAEKGQKADVLAGPWAQPILGNCSYINRLWIHAPALRQYVRDNKKLPKNMIEEWRFFRRMGKERYEAVVTTGYATFLDREVIAALRPARAVCVGEERLWGALPATTIEYRPVEKDQYEAVRLAHLVDLTPPEPVQLELDGADRLDEVFSNLAEAHQLSPSYACIAPAAGWYGKQWPEDRFRQLANHLHAAFNLQIVGLGTEPERELVGRVIDDLPGAVNLAGKTSMTEAMAVMAHARFMAANDSGLLHIGAALHTPTLSFFGPTSTTAWAPRGLEHRCIRKVDHCPGCIPWHLDAICKNDSRCMKAISVEEAIAAADELLKLKYNPNGSVRNNESPT